MQGGIGQVPQQRFYHTPNKFQSNYQKPQNFFNNNNQFRQQSQQAQAIEFDGKRLRKAVARKTVDYNSSVVKYLEARTWQRDFRDRRAIQPDFGYYSELEPPMSMLDNPVNAITTKFVRTSTNKMRCPIFCLVWTPEGRRLITGASSGEFTLWNGLTFNFETILQAHDSPVRCMVWSHSDVWMVTGDQSGYVKYWQSNMNNVKMFQAHKEPLRGISFCPTDTKFVTCADDGTVRIWDFLRCNEEKILRGHGADVKCVDWHPQKSLIVSGSKDSQQPIKLWDPKSGQGLATIHAHKSTVMEVKWNQNGTWLLTASRDHLLKLFDIRNMSQEVQTFRGHKKEACSIAWHPIHEPLFVSGGSEGSVMFWVVGNEKEVGSMEQAHDSCVWSLAWHPLGHILCTGSNDHTSKFWTRNRPGDRMRDKYNLNTMPKGQDETAEFDEPSISAIPGMGLDFSIQELAGVAIAGENEENLAIPGLDFSSEESMLADKLHAQNLQQQRKMPFSKPIPRQFQQQWMENKQPLLLAPPPLPDSGGDSNGIQNASMVDNSFKGPPGQQGSMNPSNRDYSSPNKRMPYVSPHSQEIGGQPEAPVPHRAPLLGDRPPGLPPPTNENNRLRPDNSQEMFHDHDDRNDNGAMIGGNQDERMPPFRGFVGDSGNNPQQWQQFSADNDPRLNRPPAMMHQSEDQQQQQQPFESDHSGFEMDFEERGGMQQNFQPSIRGRVKSSYAQGQSGMPVSFAADNSFENFQANNDNDPANERGGFQGGRKRPWQQEQVNDNSGFFQQQPQQQQHHQPQHRGRGFQGHGRGGRGQPRGGRGRGYRGRGRAMRGGGF